MTTDANESRDYVLQTAREHDVKFIRLWFTDILGSLKSVAITVDELQGALEEGVGFDGSSIEGFARIDESDMITMPDPTTFALLPWRPQENGVARMFCDILDTDGNPFEGDPRWVLRRNLKRASDLGFTFYVGPELEYFYFANSEEPGILDVGGYFDLTPLDAGTDLRRETVLTLEELGIARRDLPPRGRPLPARDQPPLHGRPHDGRQHDDLPPHRQGDRLQERRLRHLHAQADVGPERLRHARPPVPLHRRAQRLLRRERPVPPLGHRPQLHRRPAHPRPRRSPSSPTSGSTPTSVSSPASRPPSTSPGPAATARTSSASPSTSAARKTPPASSTARRTPPATRTSPSPPCSPPASKASRTRWSPPSLTKRTSSR